MTNVPFQFGNNGRFDPSLDAHPWMGQLEEASHIAITTKVSIQVRNKHASFSRIDATLWQQAGAPAALLWQHAAQQPVWSISDRPWWL